MRLTLYDSTLREGMQGAGASFTLGDKLRIALLLDELGIDFIEAGNPGSNPKDVQFYQQMQLMQLKHAKLVAFGATCHPRKRPEEDENLRALLSAKTEYIAIFGKTWDFHVTEVLKTTLEHNIELIKATLSYLIDAGRKVIFDAEHFFDGYKRNPIYAIQALRAANEAGAEWLCLCDTNGGCFPFEIEEITKEVVKEFGTKVGIHCHNDTGNAMANSIAAVRQGAIMAQATINGWGERCGNCDLCVLIPNLQLKLGYECVEPQKLTQLQNVARTACELLNRKHDPRTPYIGRNAFAHKGGMHIDGISKNPQTFEHVDPELIGVERRILVSEVAGRKAIKLKLEQYMGEGSGGADAAGILAKLKELELAGYQFEGADASFELIVRRHLKQFEPFFHLRSFRVSVDEPSPKGESASAMLVVVVDGKEEIAAALGGGPVEALDKAMRKALERFYPNIRHMYLSDFRVRVLDSQNATAARVRVMIESSNGAHSWTTVGVSQDVIEAALVAMIDAMDYFLLKYC